MIIRFGTANKTVVAESLVEKEWQRMDEDLQDAIDDYDKKKRDGTLRDSQLHKHVPKVVFTCDKGLDSSPSKKSQPQSSNNSPSKKSSGSSKSPKQVKRQ